MKNNSSNDLLSIQPNFLRNIIESDKNIKKYFNRFDNKNNILPNLITRFPPEPNGYLHIGHAKAICLNFGLASEFHGRCHLRFDDTNPTKENKEFVNSIIDNIDWLGFSFKHFDKEHKYFVSDYFEQLYLMARWLIQNNYAYIDSQLPNEIIETRGDFNKPGINSSYRDRPSSESLKIFEEMRNGKYTDGKHVLRAKIDMSSPNMNMRDPILYRIRHVNHHRTGSKWCIYPMYDFAHPISDAIENITHSFCTLEFEDHRPFYEWILKKLCEGNFFKEPLPKQYEFARLNLTHTITSKRKLLSLVNNKLVDGWDDPRMPTIVGLRRRGYTPTSIKIFSERIGVTKSESLIDSNVLDGALREDLDPIVPRFMAVLDPIKLVIENFPKNKKEQCSAPMHPHHPDMGLRNFILTRELWIEKEDFKPTPQKGFFRLFPGNMVRLRYGFVIKCTGFEKNNDGKIIKVLCEYYPDSKSGTSGSSNYKVKGNIHWLSAEDSVKCEVRIFNHLFIQKQPNFDEENIDQYINKNSKIILSALLEHNVLNIKPDEKIQFERHGFFVADINDSQIRKPIFNRITTLKDSKNK